MVEPDGPVFQASVSRLKARLADDGIICFGGFIVEPDDIGDAAHAPLAGRHALLFGNAGSAMWARFSASPEHADGRTDPMNRWTRRVTGEALSRLAAGERAFECLYPFGDPARGEPIWPFQRWAKRAMGLKSSPLGLLIHPRYGLWFALRAAIVLPLDGMGEPGEANAESGTHPCDDCADRPCLSACPVGAYGQEGFDATACRSHLASGKAPDCMALGCADRNACPVGVQWRYEEAQLRFHMAAFKR